ncbi:MAG TPA: SH3 domain-containing protein [Gemmatimonadales bacterium]|nr:SH3 domain-containing protein [Gemmatimonadales bacterium]
MTQAPQSSPALRRLPACALTGWLALAGLTSGPLHAQDDARATRDAPFARSADGRVLGTLRSGADVTVRGARGGWVEVTLSGWIFERSVERNVRDGFDLGVSASGGENLRAEPNGRVLARFRTGTLLERIATRGDWIRVRRRGWVPRSAIAREVETAEAPGRRARAGAPNRRERARPALARGDSTPPDTTPPIQLATAGTRLVEEARVQVTRSTAVHAAPDAAEMGTLQPGATGRVLGRAGEWVRVQLEGWIRAADVGPPSDGALVGVSAAELRAEPGRYVGQLVEWRIQFIAVQEADELRSELPAGQPFLLTRGPLPEPGFVYVILPRADAERFRALPALQELVVHVRVKAPRTRYLTTPVVELASVVSGLPGK